MKGVVITGFSIKKDLFERIEAERGDVSRSKFVQRLLEAGLKDRENQNQTEYKN